MKNELSIVFGGVEGTAPAFVSQARRSRVNLSPVTLEICRGLRARIQKVPPFLALAKARSQRKVRISITAPCPYLPMGERNRRAEVRAAEMAAWEASGGDALRSE